MSISTKKVEQVLKEAECLFDQDEVEEAIRVMAGEIMLKLKESNPIILTVMNGGVVSTINMFVLLFPPHSPALS